MFMIIKIYKLIISLFTVSFLAIFQVHKNSEPITSGHNTDIIV